MSLAATSYRYEIENCNAKAIQKALARQQFRIKEDELYATRENTVDSDRMVNEVSKWSENLDEASHRRRAKRERNEIKEEIRLGNESSIMVRRAQLQKLLLKEEHMFAEELEKKLGLAFYMERL